MLEILGVHHRDSKNLYMLCKCHCGNETVALNSQVKSGRRSSCGCTRTRKNPEKDIASLEARKQPSFRTWQSMNLRCNNPNAPDYHNYGGRGIKVCAEWRFNYNKFVEDMGVRPLGKTLDRINNSKGYSKENCRWATYKEQNNNRRDNKYHMVFGEMLQAEQIIFRYGLTPKQIQYWTKKGVSIEDVINKQRETCKTAQAG